MAQTWNASAPGGTPEEPFLRVQAHRTMLKAYILSIVHDAYSPGTNGTDPDRLAWVDVTAPSPETAAMPCGCD